MKPLFIKKNGTVSKVSGIVMNLIPSYTLAEYNALTHKPLFWVRTDEDYAQIPASNVSYGSGSVKDALDVLTSKKWKFFFYAPLTTTATTYAFPSSIADYDDVIITCCWNYGRNTVWAHIPIVFGEVSLASTYLMFNNSPTSTHYINITDMTTTSITAQATSTSAVMRVYVR